MIESRLRLMRELLSPSGTFCIHLGYDMIHYVKTIADELLGEDGFLNEIVWHWTNAGGRAGSGYARKHNTILIYTQGAYAFNWQEAGEKRVQDASQFGSYFKTDSDGRMYQEVRTAKKVYRYYLDDPKIPDDVWQIQMMGQHDKTERTGFATQKPEALLERIVAVHSKKGDLVADFFCGSGTTLAVSERLGRRWIGCDLGRWALHVTRKRLLGIKNAKPFEVLNLGKYERQYWLGITFGEDLDRDGEMALYEYLAFILKLYGASPITGTSHLHGRRSSAVIHVGGVESPVTIDEISEAIEECVALKQNELHVLGWEWEMGLAGPNNDYRKGGLLHEVAKEKGIRLLLLQIPREVMEQQAVERGDISFFELAYLDLGIKQQKKRVTVELKDFVIPNTELIPEQVRDKITKWSDYIDYWAIDWDFRNDTFMQGWVTYRTRKDRSLALTSDAHTYEEPGSYRIVVKVIDIFGNDTSQSYDIKVS